MYKPLKYLSISLFEDIFQNKLNSNFEDVDKPKRISSLTALAAQFTNKYLTVTGSLLATYVDESVQTETPPEDKKKITPSISVSYLPFEEANLRLRGSYKKIFRVPTFDDMYYTRMGNYKSETGICNTIQCGIDLDKKYLRLLTLWVEPLDGYKNKVDEKTKAFPTMNIFKMRNYGKVDMTGVDLNLRLHALLTSQISLNITGNYSYQRVIDVTG